MGNCDWVDNTLILIHKVLNNHNPPKEGDGCKWCQYRRIEKKEDKNKNGIMENKK